jgi:hypothetical protein
MPHACMPAAEREPPPRGARARARAPPPRRGRAARGARGERHGYIAASSPARIPHDDGCRVWACSGG